MENTEKPENDFRGRNWDLLSDRTRLEPLVNKLKETLLEQDLSVRDVKLTLDYLQSDLNRAVLSVQLSKF